MFEVKVGMLTTSGNVESNTSEMPVPAPAIIHALFAESYTKIRLPAPSRPLIPSGPPK